MFSYLILLIKYYKTCDDFTMVPYLWTATVPPHWVELVRSSAAVSIYTKKQVGTWQSISGIEAEDGDFSGKNQSSTTSNQTHEGVKNGNVRLQHNISLHWLMFADEFVQNDTDTIFQQPIAEHVQILGKTNTNQS
jgi:hypothetical protein